MSQPTSLSLLQRMRDPHDGRAWSRFVDSYQPLLRNWLRAKNVAEADADDIVQNIMAVVVKRIGDFQHNGRPGAFRTWLRSIMLNCLQESWRARKANPHAVGGSEILALVNGLEDPESDVSRQWDAEHDKHVMQQLLLQLRDEFEPRTWLAFEKFALEGKPAGEVAKDLGITSNAVFIAKSRVLTRLRQESHELLD